MAVFAVLTVLGEDFSWSLLQLVVMLVVFIFTSGMAPACIWLVGWILQELNIVDFKKIFRKAMKRLYRSIDLDGDGTVDMNDVLHCLGRGKAEPARSRRRPRVSRFSHAL